MQIKNYIYLTVISYNVSMVFIYLVLTLCIKYLNFFVYYLVFISIPVCLLINVLFLYV